jgi:hypothetical protein
MDHDDALQKIDDYISNPNTNVGEKERELHSKLTALKTMVFSEDYDDKDLLTLISEICTLYDSITDKASYEDIMKVVQFFKQHTEDNIKLNINVKNIYSMLEKLRKNH